MIITKKRLSRRTLLRGAGAVVALPVLDAMTPAFAASEAPKQPVRMLITYIPNGVAMQDWTPEGTGSGYELSSTLRPFAPHRDEMFVLSGLADYNGNALGDGGGDHARAGGSFLTGSHPFKTSGKDIEAGISVDQLAANAVGSATRFGSLELGCEDSRTVGNCDSGYSCAYTNSLSWRGPNTPNPAETNPRAVFERFFGTEDVTLPSEIRAKRREDRRSILDMVLEDTASLKKTLGGADSRKMDEYLTGIREVEGRIQLAESQKAIELTPDFEKPVGPPLDFSEYAELMLDLARIAFEADLTRIATVIFGREGSLRTYRQIGVPEGHHPLSHHGNRPESLAKLARINQLHTETFARFIGKLKATPDGAGTLLDNSMIMYGSGLSDSNRHIHENLPILLFGRGGGDFKPGRHIAYPDSTPLANLYLTMLGQMGVSAERFGDSVGTLGQLS